MYYYYYYYANFNWINALCDRGYSILYWNKNAHHPGILYIQQKMYTNNLRKSLLGNIAQKNVNKKFNTAQSDKQATTECV